MKNLMKKILVTICAVSASLTLVTASVYATDSIRAMPDSSADQAVTTSAGDQAVTDTETEEQATEETNNNVVTGSAVNNVTTNTSTTTNTTNKKYQTRLGGFLWFLLSVVVNFIISCWIGNRFYKLARRNAQGSSEIRALRKDIEEKFASTLNDISEPAVEVMNQNESYARTDEGLSMPEKRNKVELNDEELEMMRKWDSRRAASKAADEENEDEYEEYEEDTRSSRTARSAYQPTRRSSGIDFGDDDEQDDEEYDEEYEDRYSQKKRPSYMNRRESAKKTVRDTKGKAKKLLNNVFPIDD